VDKDNNEVDLETKSEFVEWTLIVCDEILWRGILSTMMSRECLEQLSN
jgi:hypothetical protein